MLFTKLQDPPNTLFGWRTPPSKEEYYSRAVFFLVFLVVVFFNKGGLHRGGGGSIRGLRIKVLGCTLRLRIPLQVFFSSQTARIPSLTDAQRKCLILVLLLLVRSQQWFLEGSEIYFTGILFGALGDILGAGLVKPDGSGDLCV